MKAETALPSGSEILVLEDDLRLRRRLVAHLKSNGCETAEAASLAEARRQLASGHFDFMVADINLPDGDLFELLREGLVPDTTALVVMTAFGGVDIAVEAMRLGAGDYLSKPFEPDELVLAFLRCRRERHSQRREESLRRHNAPSPQDGDLLFGASLAPLASRLEALFAAEKRLVRGLPPVLIEGETGTGKTVLARWIHARGPRADKPFVPVNCAALPDTLAESELFGHERGAFTDAKQGRVGLLEAADGGTLFLDEVGSLSPAAQAKILTAVEESRIRRLGGTREIAIDARIIAASNQPLSRLCAEGRFREDLLHRLNLLHFTLPPLRERGSDILALARHLLAQTARRHHLKPPPLSPAGEQRLLSCPWRGNLRELTHEIERALIFAPPGAPLDFADLPAAPQAPHAPDLAPACLNPAWKLPAEGFNLDALVDDLVSLALRETSGNVSAAARRLGVTREFLRYRLKENEKTSPTTSEQLG